MGPDDLPGSSTQRLEIIPLSGPLTVGTNIALTARSVRGEEITDVTESVEWSSADPNIVAVSSVGVASARSAGRTSVVAKRDDLRASLEIEIVVSSSGRLSLEPQMLELLVGESAVVTASSPNATWSVVPASGVIMIEAVGDTGRLVTAVAPGTAALSAEIDGASASTVIVVREAEPTMLTVSTDATDLAVGDLAEVSAVLVYDDQTTLDVSGQVQWTSSPELEVALGGIVRGVQAGVGRVQATHLPSGLTGGVTIRVNDAVLQSLQIEPLGRAIAMGTRVALRAMGVYSDGSVRDLTEQVSWQSTQPSVCSVVDSGPGAGLLAGITPGSCLISITHEPTGMSVSADFEVRAVELSRLEVSPPNPRLAAGLQRQLSAIGIFSDQSSQDLTAAVEWSCANEAVARVRNTPGLWGTLEAVSAGSTRCTATFGTISGSVDVSVTAATVTRLEIQAPDSDIALGQTVQLRAVATLSDGNEQDFTTAVTWQGDARGILFVDNAPGRNGRVEAQRVGTATVTAVHPPTQLSAQLVLRVTDAVVQSVSITPANASVPLGATEQYTATAIMSDGSRRDVTAEATWTVSPPTVAEISNAACCKGLVTPRALGQGTVRAQIPQTTIQGTTSVRVIEAAIVRLTLSPSPLQVASGATGQLTAMATLSDGNTREATGELSWSSSDTGVATVSNAAATRGEVTGVGTGTARITATHAPTGVTASASVAVSAAFLTRLDIAPLQRTLRVGGSLQMSAYGTLSDGTQRDETRNARWVSNRPGVATVGANDGLVTAVSAGTATITVTLVPLMPQSAVITVQTAPVPSLHFSEDFESGIGRWTVTNGVWQLGAPTSGPRGAFAGQAVAATVLTGNYFEDTRSRLVSPEFRLPQVSRQEELRLTWWQWFQLDNTDYCRIQIQVRDATGAWGAWTNIAGTSLYSAVWSRAWADLSRFSGATVRLGFFLEQNRDRWGGGGVGQGCYIDEVRTETRPVSTLPFSEGFELSAEGWGVDNGVWQFGAPSAGPSAAAAGSGVAGTVLGGNYPEDTGARLVSPPIQLPASASIDLRFDNWFCFDNTDYGSVQISQETAQGVWSAWTTIHSYSLCSPIWTEVLHSIGPGNRKVRVGFLLEQYRDRWGGGGTSHGWFVDRVRLAVP